MNFPKVRVTYIKSAQNFQKQCVPNFILHKFAAIQTSQHKLTVQWEYERAMEILRRKTEQVSYPLREMDQYEDQSKDILNSILNIQ